jgi:hypothetical protein
MGMERGGDSPRMVLRQWGDQRVVRDGGQLAPIFNDSGVCPMALWLDQDRAASPRCPLAGPSDLFA